MKRTAVIAVIVVVVAAGTGVGVLVLLRAGQQATTLGGGTSAETVECPRGRCPALSPGRAVTLWVTGAGADLDEILIAVPAAARRRPLVVDVDPVERPLNLRGAALRDHTLGALAVGPMVKVSPQGETFDAPVEITLPYDPARVPADLPEQRLVVLQASEDVVGLLRWETHRTLERAPESGTLTFHARSLGHFVVAILVPRDRLPAADPAVDDPPPSVAGPEPRREADPGVGAPRRPTDAPVGADVPVDPAWPAPRVVRPAEPPFAGWARRPPERSADLPPVDPEPGWVWGAAAAAARVGADLNQVAWRRTGALDAATRVVP